MKLDTNLRRFDDSRYYSAADEAMRFIGTVGTLSVWRRRGLGPPFFKIGRRVFYLGSDLNQWCDSQRVIPHAG